MAGRRRGVGTGGGERALMSEAIGQTVVEDLEVLGARTAALDARLARLEHRVSDADLVAPDHGDVLDAHLRTARLAAELHLVSLELRTELARLRASIGDRAAVEPEGRIDELAGALVTLAGDLDAAVSDDVDD